LMTVLTVGLFVPQFFMAQSVADQVNAINFIFDTLLFGGMVLIVGAAARLRNEAAEPTEWVQHATPSEQGVPV